MDLATLKMKDVLLRHHPELEPALEGWQMRSCPGTRSQRMGR
jgi:hypothetical protein